MALKAVRRTPGGVVAGAPGAGRAMTRALAVVTALMLTVTLLGALVWAPEDAAQGAAQRIFYIHVPSAWVSFLAFAVVFYASIAFLISGKARYDTLASASAGIGVVFTSAVLITGPLWARPVWGVYWSWDPRLTSVFILWLMYVSYVVVRSYVPDPARRARFSAVLGIVAFVNVPIVFLSVRLWRALHPEPVVVRRGGPAMPAEMLLVLLAGVLAFTLLYLVLLRVRIEVGRMRLAEQED